MLLPPLKTQDEYVELAEAAGLKVLHPPKDISKDVAKTWYVCIVTPGHPVLSSPKPVASRPFGDRKLTK